MAAAESMAHAIPSPVKGFDISGRIADEEQPLGGDVRAPRCQQRLALPGGGLDRLSDAVGQCRAADSARSTRWLMHTAALANHAW